MTQATAKAPITARLPNVSVWVFAAAVFISAFLLFQVQPLISKAILPWFGGTPSVWTTCLLFFQALLFGGYAYAHGLSTWLPLRLQAVVHLGLLLVAVVLLGILPESSMVPNAAERPVLQILALLGRTVGLPFVVLSTTGPLLQRWFSLAHADRSPYRLYSLSNVGSLLALLSYPFVFEPMLSLPAQARVWSALFWVFALLCAGCALRVMALAPMGSGSVRSELPAPADLARWFLLAMLASTLLLATTNQVCQDVAVVPFLWVVPLALYLGSFILCFQSDRWYGPRLFAVASGAGIVGVSAVLVYGAGVPILLQLAVYFAALFAICMLCHGELARSRPDPQHLTAYYLAIAGGGAGGGLFVALAAPLLFPDFWELHLALIAAAVLAGWTYLDAPDDDTPPLAILIAAALVIAAIGTVFVESIGYSRRMIAVCRNFYGTLKVEQQGNPEVLILRHGRIIHGLQFRDGPWRHIPTTYYGPQTGIGRLISTLQLDRPSMRVGLVGLGVGTLAAYARPEDTYRFYEINADVERLAREHFTFLSDCQGECEVVLGDARQLLQHEPPQRFDVLVLDAFSGDAIPAHLLTREAMQVYLSHLGANGVVAFHISNKHFDLRPVVEALADHFRLHAATLEVEGKGPPVDPSSTWVLVSSSAELLSRPSLRQVTIPPSRKRVLWTDDFSNLFELLRGL